MRRRSVWLYLYLAIEPAAWRLSEAHRFESIVAGAIHDPDAAHAAGFLDEVVAADAVVERAMGHAARLAGALPAASLYGARGK